MHINTVTNSILVVSFSYGYSSFSLVIFLNCLFGCGYLLVIVLILVIIMVNISFAFCYSFSYPSQFLLVDKFYACF